ncbi:MAG: hypothetical protein ACI36W_01535 [Coriobacteriales bacterium]
MKIEKNGNFKELLSQMYYNPMMNILLRMLGQAAVEQMMGGQRQAPQQAADDDTPIDVEAQVVDDEGKTREERAHERWEQERAQEASHQLQGEVTFFASKGYVLATGIATVLLLLAGVVLRVYSLIMGNIFSMTIVPVVLGVLAALALMLVAALLMWRMGPDKVPFCEVDLVMVFFSAALMGWGNLLPAIAAALLCWAFMKAANGKRAPFFAVFLVVGAVQFFTIGFPGLISLF